MAKLSRSAAPLLAVAVLALIALLPLSSAYAAAQLRTEVVVYSARIEQLIKPMFDAFTEKTGIQVKYFTAGEKELFERLHSEGANTPADVFMTVDVGNLWIAEQAGLLQGVTSEVIDRNIPSHLRAQDNAWVGLSVRAGPIMYSTERVTPSELSTYEALGDPKWQGKLCLPHLEEGLYPVAGGRDDQGPGGGAHRGHRASVDGQSPADLRERQ